MAKKCSLCGEKVEITFLGKVIGTYIKKKLICNKCQRKLKGELKDKIK